ncbi:2-oxoacid:acceptor oxidoreductase family protein [Tepidibacillus fermentans]|uniref:Pyruvate ferredoxin oxidoreductase gamma subunit n=1 Tax=Tepidibacillus fermentans TaxID=1281767 RepID=A0A4R3KKU0_9BACI|nr:2-oxoacid:acceptor oxidoreductase family protein [Tepidibacillus fermentans]TCS84110.1 pyruvate ferredoxin oxidoreductase gamma subunit [Tepidibacillus fermentans]
MSKLPIKNELGFFEIRLESIGGLGAHLAGKMLAEAGVLGLGLNGAHFSSYGSEKKGSPVKSFIRFGEGEIRASSPIERPHIVGVFHENLFKTIDVANGLYPDGVIVVNTTKTPDEIRERFNIKSGTVAVVDALGISVEEKTRVNTAMLGAIFRVASFLDPESMRNVIRQTFEEKYPKLVDSNIRTFDRGFNEVQFKTYEAEEGAVAEYVRPKSALGYETQPIGGVIINPGNSILKDLSSSRQGFLPAFEQEKCINCANCDFACPDLCFVWEEKEDKKGRPQMFLQGIDYQYCKGCMKCVAVCPTGALTKVREVDGYADEHRVPHQFVLASN